MEAVTDEVGLAVVPSKTMSCGGRVGSFSALIVTLGVASDVITFPLVEEEVVPVADPTSCRGIYNVLRIQHHIRIWFSNG